MTAQPLEPEYAEVPLPDLAAVHTHSPSSVPALVHLPDDPRHLTYHYGNYEQTTWTEEDQ